MKPDVSIIIPNYNCKPYLAKAISSVVKQTRVNIEIIVIDDGSSDGSVKWLKAAKQTFNEIKIIEQQNAGVVNARNTAIAEAQADYIAFLDADDYWSEDKLSTQINYMKNNPRCALTFTNYMHVDEQYTPIVDCFTFWPEFLKKINPHHSGYQPLKSAFNVLLYANVIGTSSVVVKREAINHVGGFDTSLKSASDWDCWLKIAYIGEVAFSSACSMGYLMRQNSITANRENRLLAMKHIIARSKACASFSAKVKVKARMLECYGEYYRELGFKFKALSKAVAAFSLFPHKRNLRHLLHDVKTIIWFKSTNAK
jgi:glycosyltransferase involved in cell wall biosynthesis